MNLISWTNHSFLFSKKDYYCQSQVEFPPTSSLRRGGDVFDGKFRFRDVSKTKSSIGDASLPLRGRGRGGFITTYELHKYNNKKSLHHKVMKAFLYLGVKVISLTSDSETIWPLTSFYDLAAAALLEKELFFFCSFGSISSVKSAIIGVATKIEE